MVITIKKEDGSTKKPTLLGKKVADFSIAAEQIKDILSETGVSDVARLDALEQLSALSQSLHSVAQKVVESETERYHLSTISSITKKINSYLSTEEVLNQIMDSIIEITDAERAFLMLLNEEDQLEMRVGRNWEQRSEGNDALISHTVAERVAETGDAVLTSNASEDPSFSAAASVLSQSLRSILCVPLTIKEKTIGVIYADSRIHVGLFTYIDLQLLASFGDQAALALENANLVEGLRLSNQNLEQAYETTLVGWAKALELRDNETQGHTVRVTELTLELAKYMGMNGEILKHIQRGAILHDIGKMGIPDSILLKPDTLTDEETKVMQMHPIYARELLEQIPFLLPSLDIPLHHHERWDGTGYPDGLKGLGIPLSARIFMVVDVWDALVSDRPYRGAMPEKLVLTMIEEQSGKHFDPMIVDKFVDFIKENKNI